MHFDFSLFMPVLGTIAVAIGTWISNKFVKTSNDAKRADLLTKIADDALALILMNNPARISDVGLLMNMLVDAIRKAQPTLSLAVVNRVASGAISRAQKDNAIKAVGDMTRGAARNLLDERLADHFSASVYRDAAKAAGNLPGRDPNGNPL